MERWRYAGWQHKMHNVHSSSSTPADIRAGWGLEFLQAFDGAIGRLGEDLLCCCLCAILHLVTLTGLCGRSISAYVDKMCVICSYAWVFICACTCVSLLSSFGEEDEQRSKVTAHKAALKVIRVIPAPGSSCSFPLPRTHWMRCTCTSDMVQQTVNSRLLTANFFFLPISYSSRVS